MPFYQVGGTLPVGGPYVERPADSELLRLVLEGIFCYVLTPRQTGKSSLMVRTARRLAQQGVRTAIIDLTSIGTGAVGQWYLGLLTRMSNGLQFSVDMETWWQERDALSSVQRFTDFMREVVLDRITGQVVIFLDEIDSTLKLDFRDDFFAAIRSIYNARADVPAFKRLTFVLLGVAAPNDLISDPQRTPFNIGKAIDLKDFTLQNSQTLRGGLDSVYPDKSGVVFDRIFYWTDGHPYLTQMLCASMLDIPPEWWNADGVDDHVYKHLISGAPHSDINLQTVQDSTIKSSQRGKLLSLYKEVYRGRRVPEDERSSEQNYLKLFGLVRAEGGGLQVRNEIYRRVFDDNWIKKNTPVGRMRRILVALAAFVLVLTIVTLYSVYARPDLAAGFQAQVITFGFNTANRADVRLGKLAELFGLTGQADAARKLFYSLNQSDKLALFNDSASQASGSQLITVITGVYAQVPNDSEGNELLRAMDTALSKLDDPAARLLHNEIQFWVNGRASYNGGNYAQAVEAYTSAIRSLNSRSPGIYLDRAQANARQNQIGLALDDLQTILTLNPPPSWKDRVTQVLQADQALVEAVRSQRDKYPALTALVP